VTRSTSQHGYLLAISVGPVQGFISAARRTRDLWFGSYVLSEIAKAVAMCLLDCGGRLIFPVVDGLSAGTQGRTGPAELKTGVSNKLLASFEGATRQEPASVARLCREAARTRWLGFAEDARARASGLGLAVRDDLWQEQVDDVIEVYSAWVPLAGRDDYSRAYNRLEAILSGRKLTRDFLPATGRFGVPKSVLDGARESVIDPQSVPVGVLRKCGLKRGEYLDAVGVIKRLGGTPRQFPPVCRVAAQPWLEALRRVYGDNVLRELNDCLDRLADQGYVSRCSWPGAVTGSDGTDQLLPFEAEPLFAGRRTALMKEIIAERGDPSPLRRIGELVGSNEPCPYLAVLVGDGDHMGATLSVLPSAEDHRSFSSVLAQFAEQADKVVAGRGGCLVYSGGDDVLALLPVSSALDAAEELRSLFLRTVSDEVRRMSAGAGQGKAARVPTFSVGIGIGHFLEPLGELLERARLAEKHAKKGSAWSPDPAESAPESGEAGRDAIAVWARARAGGDCVRFWGRWSDLGLVRTWVKAFLAGRMPSRTAYELRELTRRYRLDHLPLAKDDGLAPALEGDLKRVLRRRETTDREGLPAEVVDGLIDLCRRPGGFSRAASGLRLALLIAEGERAKAKLCAKGCGRPAVRQRSVGARRED